MGYVSARRADSSVYPSQSFAEQSRCDYNAWQNIAISQYIHNKVATCVRKLLDGILLTDEWVIRPPFKWAD